MPAEDHFINRGLLKVKINDFLRRELRRAGYAGVDLQKTPLGMRVVVYASRPGMVIGRRGTTVRELTETLEHDFGLEAPQIEVSEVEVPELNGSIMAERLAQRLERGDHFRRAAYGVLRRIVGTGAKGVEISIAGKLTSRRARYQKFRSGYVAKTGEPIRTAVSHGIAYAIMKPGILGIQVRIMLPDAVAPDRPIIIHREVEIEPVPEAAEGAEAAEIEVTEEELPIEEAPPIEEFIEESKEPSPVAATPSESELEPVPEPEPEDVPPLEEKAEPEKPKPKPKKKPKAEPAKKKAPAKVKPKPKAKKEAEKPKAKPKAKKKVEEKPKAKPKTTKKAAEKPKAKPKKTQVEAKPKAKKKKVEEKPKSKTKAAEKPKAETKAKAKKDTAESKSKKSETKASKEKAAKSTKSASKK